MYAELRMKHIGGRIYQAKVIGLISGDLFQHGDGS